MYSKKQLARAQKSVVHKIKEIESRIHFKVIYIDNKQKRHEHYVIFLKNKPLMKSWNCDCTWCSYYGWDKRNKKLIKLCSNCLAVAKYLKIPEIAGLFEKQA